MNNFLNNFSPFGKGGPWGDLKFNLASQIPPRFAGLPFLKGEVWFNLKFSS